MMEEKLVYFENQLNPNGQLVSFYPLAKVHKQSWPESGLPAGRSSVSAYNSPKMYVDKYFTHVLM